MEQYVKQITISLQLIAMFVRQYLSSRGSNVWIFMILVQFFNIFVALGKGLWLQICKTAVFKRNIKNEVSIQSFRSLAPFEINLHLKNWGLKIFLNSC